MKIAFAVWTPLHLYNVLRYILSNDLFGKTDVYYISQSEGMGYYLNNIKKEKVFRNIFSTSTKELEKHQVFWERSSVVFSPKLYVRHLFGKKACGREYDQLFISVQTKLNDAIFRANECKEVIGFDDGTGSYICDLYGTPPWRYYNAIKAMKKEPFIHVKQVFLSSPEYKLLEDDRIEFKMLEARLLSNEEKKLIRKVFEYEKHYDLPNCIYLNQPIYETPNPTVHKEREKEIIGLLCKIKRGELAVRLHPREREKEIYKGLIRENEHTMWEIICENEMTSDHTLISAFSTAQFTPKMYFGKEPNLIFTFKLYDDYTADQIEIFQELVNKLRCKYSNQSHIMEPETIEEFIKCISKGYSKAI